MSYDANYLEVTPESIYQPQHDVTFYRVIDFLCSLLTAPVNAAGSDLRILRVRRTEIGHNLVDVV